MAPDAERPSRVPGARHKGDPSQVGTGRGSGPTEEEPPAREARLPGSSELRAASRPGPSPGRRRSRRGHAHRRPGPARVGGASAGRDEAPRLKGSLFQGNAKLSGKQELWALSGSRPCAARLGGRSECAGGGQGSGVREKHGWEATG